MQVDVCRSALYDGFSWIVRLPKREREKLFEFFTSDMSVGSFIAEWSGIVLLVCLSGLFSGLTLGLLSLDKVGLEIVIGSGSAQDSKYAKRIYPLRKRGNLLLCVLLLGNVAVNALLSILLADKTSGFVGFLVSTAVIVIFGEITPQSVCSRHGLAIGYYTVWLVWIFLILMFPIAFPISLVLDLVLGREIGTIYSRDELKKLLEIHGHHMVSDITSDEGSILSGVLDFSLKPVADAMTPIESVFMMEIDECLDMQTLTHILEHGFSRVPIYEKTPQSIVGLLFVKDLALLDPRANTPIRDILEHFNRPLPRVFDNVRLGEMLKEFKAGRSHMAVVRRVENENGPGDPYYENVGIITLEDVIEEIINDEIVDETDVYVDNRSGVAVRGRNAIDYRQAFSSASASPLAVGAAASSSPSPSSSSAAAFDIASMPGVLSNDEIARICTSLSTHVAEFSPRLVSPEVLFKLVAQSKLLLLDGADPDSSRVYSSGQDSPYLSVLVDGKLRVQGNSGDRYTLRASADDAELPSLGIAALRVERFEPDFSAWATAPSRVLQITRHRYTASKQATTFEARGPSGASTLRREHIDSGNARRNHNGGGSDGDDDDDGGGDDDDDSYCDDDGVNYNYAAKKQVGGGQPKKPKSVAKKIRAKFQPKDVEGKYFEQHDDDSKSDDLDLVPL
jgi:metal transporter CNNM